MNIIYIFNLINITIILNFKYHEIMKHKQNLYFIKGISILIWQMFIGYIISVLYLLISLIYRLMQNHHKNLQIQI